ncbi:hypothetical protein FKP32DRAFT_724551 [Trametes sanguinea]|nr:hypothetical protein FKP32DRAFT_724551 [Trametes sanguinea]
MQPVSSSPRRPLPNRPLPASSPETLQPPQLELQVVPEGLPDKLSESLNRLEPQAEKEIEDVSKILDSLPLAHARQDIEEITKQVVEGVSHVLDYMGVVAQVHPIAGIVVGALSKVVSMEKQRHENNAHIVVVHATMVKTVYHVRFLARIPAKDEADFADRLNVIFQHMYGTIRDFGAFVDTYHGCWQKTYKVLFSHVHKEKLENFNKRFQQHREDLDEMRKTLTQVQMSNILTNTEEILHRLQDFDPDVQKAEKFVRENGGADRVRADPALVDKVANILQERATVGMKENLRQGFDDLLEKHNARYLKKLDSVQDTILSSVSAAEKAIISRLDEGPHHLIEDNDIRQIWERNRWKSCVKCRIFIEGLHEHYQAVFHQHGAHKDAWTLPFFSRVMYHSAIGDVIDDDGSGYLSASEVNDFISEQRCLSHWSKPEWFAFWACGWYNNNAWYHRGIKHIMLQLQDSLHSIADMPERDTVLLIVESLKPLVLVADVEDFSYIVKIPHQLRRLQEEYRSYEERKITENLAHFGNHVADRTSLDTVVGDTRVELHMMPLLYILVIRLQEIVAEILRAGSISNQNLVGIEELATSCIAVFVAFEDRMRDLLRGWRCEGKDIGMQVDRYADGLFKKLYQETHLYEKPYHALRGCIFGDKLTMPRHLRPFASPHRSQNSVDRLAREVTSLSSRVEVLENRLSQSQEPRAPRAVRSRTSSTGTGQSSSPATLDRGAPRRPVMMELSEKRTSRWRTFLHGLRQLFLH